MRRKGNLFEEMVSFENLHRAARKARRGKRDRMDVATFEFDRERELLSLHEELAGGAYRPGPFRTFRIREPKERLISAAPYRDRVVHHAILNVLEPIFDACFVSDSYSCRPAKGTHRALDRFTEHARQNPWVLKADVSKYFPSIDHGILRTLFARKLKDRRVLALLDHIVDGSNAQEEVLVHYPGDDLFTPLERRRGIPIGNLTSQFFANVYLDPLDHHVLEVLRVPGYIRYTDDFVVFGPDARSLHRVREAIEHFLAHRLRLTLHPRKTQVFPVSQGTDFLGFRVFPRYRLLRATTLSRRRRRFRALARRFARGQATVDDVRASIQSWLGHVKHASARGLTSATLADLAFSTERGRS